MKKLLLALLLLPTMALAQTNLSQGGTGWNTSTAGDLFVGTSSLIRYSRLPIGTAGTLLQSSSTSPYKMSWVATSSLGFPSIAGFVTNTYASSTFPTFGYSTSTFSTFSYGSSTFPTFSYASSTFLSSSYGTSTFVTYPYASSTFTQLFANLSTNNVTATGTLNVTGLSTLGNASTTNLSASTGATLASLNIPGTSLFTGLATLANASTTNISASTGGFFAALNVSGTSLFTGLATFAKASSTQITASTGGTLAALNVTGNQVIGGTLDVTGKTTLVNASTTAVSGNLFSTSGWITTLVGTSASSTNSSIATDAYFTNFTNGSIPFFGSSNGKLTQNNANLFWDNTNFRLGIATATPACALCVATGSAAVTQYSWGTATSTSMTVDWTRSNNQYANLSTSGVTIKFVNATTTPGQTLSLTVSCPPTGTAGTITWTHVYWVNRTQPTQTTTANCLDVYFFKSTYSTSSTPLTPGVIIVGNQSPNF